MIEVEGPTRVSPNDLAEAFSKALDRSVAPKIAPRDEWEAVFRAQGMTNPTPRMRMLDGTLKLTSQAGRGTRVEAVVPITARPA